MLMTDLPSILNILILKTMFYIGPFIGFLFKNEEGVMRFYSIAMTILGLVLVFSASAHTELDRSMPSSNESLTYSPEQLTLTFNGEIRLARVQLSDSNGQAISFNFKPNVTPAKVFSWALPKLAEGQYFVKWVGLGEDGHKVSGHYEFLINSRVSGI